MTIVIIETRALLLDIRAKDLDRAQLEIAQEAGGLVEYRDAHNAIVKTTVGDLSERLGRLAQTLGTVRPVWLTEAGESGLKMGRVVESLARGSQGTVQLSAGAVTPELVGREVAAVVPKARLIIVGRWSEDEGRALAASLIGHRTEGAPDPLVIACDRLGMLDLHIARIHEYLNREE